VATSRAATAEISKLPDPEESRDFHSVPTRTKVAVAVVYFSLTTPAV
jgi:hypothetical protein